MNHQVLSASARNARGPTPGEHLTFLVTKSGKPYRGNDFSEQFRKWSDDAGLPHCSEHGLRKAGCRRMAEAAALR